MKEIPITQGLSNEPPEPKFDPLAQYGRVSNKGRKEHCPVCFRPYELIDNELVQTCFHPQNSNVCVRCGMDNCKHH